MRQQVGVLAILASAVLTAADVQIFFSNDVHPWVAPGPANVLAPSAWNGTDYTSDGYVAEFANYPSAFVPNATVGVGETAYIWLKFNTDTQVGPIENAKLIGIDLNMPNHGGAGSAIAWYPEDDTNGTLGGKRWDYGEWPQFEFIHFHQTLVAVLSLGVRNKATDDYNMLYAGTRGRVALLGAIKIDTPGTYAFSLGTLGIYFGSAPNAPPVSFGTLTVIPEPAMVLLALAVLLLRRR